MLKLEVACYDMAEVTAVLLWCVKLGCRQQVNQSLFLSLSVVLAMVDINMAVHKNSPLRLCHGQQICF